MKISKCYCDLCKEEFNEHDLTKIKSTAVTDISQDDGLICEEHIIKIHVELCDDCFYKLVPLRVGFRGEGLKVRYEK